MRDQDNSQDLVETTVNLVEATSPQPRSFDCGEIAVFSAKSPIKTKIKKTETSLESHDESEEQTDTSLKEISFTCLMDSLNESLSDSFEFLSGKNNLDVSFKLYQNSEEKIEMENQGEMKVENYVGKTIIETRIDVVAKSLEAVLTGPPKRCNSDSNESSEGFDSDRTESLGETESPSEESEGDTAESDPKTKIKFCLRDAAKKLIDFVKNNNANAETSFKAESCGLLDNKAPKANDSDVEVTQPQRTEMSESVEADMSEPRVFKKLKTDVSEAPEELETKMSVRKIHEILETNASKVEQSENKPQTVINVEEDDNAVFEDLEMPTDNSPDKVSILGKLLALNKPLSDNGDSKSYFGKDSGHPEGPNLIDVFFPNQKPEPSVDSVASGGPHLNLEQPTRPQAYEPEEEYVNLPSPGGSRILTKPIVVNLLGSKSSKLQPLKCGANLSPSSTQQKSNKGSEPTVSNGEQDCGITDGQHFFNEKVPAESSNKIAASNLGQATSFSIKQFFSSLDTKKTTKQSPQLATNQSEVSASIEHNVLKDRGQSLTNANAILATNGGNNSTVNGNQLSTGLNVPVSATNRMQALATYGKTSEKKFGMVCDTTVPPPNIMTTKPPALPSMSVNPPTLSIMSVSPPNNGKYGLHQTSPYPLARLSPPLTSTPIYRQRYSPEIPPQHALSNAGSPPLVLHGQKHPLNVPSRASNSPGVTAEPSMSENVRKPFEKRAKDASAASHDPFPKVVIHSCTLTKRMLPHLAKFSEPLGPSTVSSEIQLCELFKRYPQYTKVSGECHPGSMTAHWKRKEMLLDDLCWHVGFEVTPKPEAGPLNPERLKFM